MSAVEINVLLTQADRQAYLACWTQRMEARAETPRSGALSWLTRRLQRPALPEAPKLEAMSLGPCSLRFESGGVRVRSGQADTLHAWTTITEGTATSHHLFLWDEALSGIIVPIRDLPASMPVSELQKRLDAVWTAAKNARPPSAMRSDLADASAASPA